MGLKTKILLPAVFFLSLLPLNTLAQSHERQWTVTKNIEGNFKAVTSQPDIEVFSSPNVILLRANQPVEVRLFTILGKLISAQKLEPGLYEYHLDSHGIYIIKTSETSCKIAI